MQASSTYNTRLPDAFGFNESGWDRIIEGGTPVKPVRRRFGYLRGHRTGP